MNTHRAIYVHVRIPHLCVLAALLLVLGCAPMVTFSEMEKSLDAQVGKPAPNYREGHARHFKYADIDAQAYELSWIRPDDCSYTFTVRKVDNIIVGWRFLKSPAPVGCKFQHVRQLM
jgi:hypothetical protein